MPKVLIYFFYFNNEKAIIRVYLVDGRFKTVVVDSNMDTQSVCHMLAEKFTLSPSDDYFGHLLYEALDYGKGKNWKEISSDVLLKKLIYFPMNENASISFHKRNLFFWIFQFNCTKK